MTIHLFTSRAVTHICRSPLCCSTEALRLTRGMVSTSQLFTSRVAADTWAGNGDDDEQDVQDDDRREDMSREESEEEAPQGPDRGRHASIRSGKKIRIFGDSRLVLQQVDGKWACAPQLWPYCAAAQVRVKWLEDQGHEMELLHVLRRFNKEADALANAGMDRPAEDAADFNIRPMPEDKAPS